MTPSVLHIYLGKMQSSLDGTAKFCSMVYVWNTILFNYEVYRHIYMCMYIHFSNELLFFECLLFSSDRYYCLGFGYVTYMA